MKMFDVSNKIIVITGGLGQLGRQFSLSLLENNAKVVIFDIKVDEQTIAKCFGERYHENNLLFYNVDLTDRSSIEQALIKVNAKVGIPHALINNAALDSPPNAPAAENGPFENYPVSSWQKVMDVNLKGVFLCSQVIGGQMAKESRGAIVNICSIYGIVSPDQRIYEYRQKGDERFYKPVAYSVSKSGLLNFTRYLSTYWAKQGVRVNTLTLGGVFNNQDNIFLQNYKAHVPLGRMANEEDYNGAIIFLISDASSYMTGSNLVIDGGWTAW